jgi:hypothetical protein
VVPKKAGYPTYDDLYTSTCGEEVRILSRLMACDFVISICPEVYNQEEGEKRLKRVTDSRHHVEA